MRQPRSSTTRSDQMSCPLQHHHHNHNLARLSCKTRNNRTNNVIRASEYRNLRQVVPSLRRQRDLGKVEVVTEAAKYIDHLHKTLIKRFVSCGIPESLKDVLGTDNANELSSQHIMNLVTQMAAKQRAGHTAQQQPSAISTSSSSAATPIQTHQHQLASPHSIANNLSTSHLGIQTTTTTRTPQRRSLPVPASKRCIDEHTCLEAHR